MGGSGSTRWRNYRRKQRVEDTLAISIHPLQRYINEVAETGEESQGQLFLIVDGRVTETSIYINLARQTDRSVSMRLRYSTGTDVPHEYDYSIALEGMASNLIDGTTGRWYFICPQCEQRRTKLYLPSETATFACRQCHNLAYRSTQVEHRFDTMLRVVSQEIGFDDKAMIHLVNRLFRQ